MKNRALGRSAAGTFARCLSVALYPATLKVGADICIEPPNDELEEHRRRIDLQ